MNILQPRVSIITPSYNQGEFIEDTILSVKNQDYPNIEHIITDGGSTDNTLEILRKYEGTYNIHWISEPDKGQADAVNKGFAMAKGEIIGWLNSDDVYLYKDTISLVVRTFCNQPDVNVVYGHVIKINPKNTILRAKFIPNFNYDLLCRWCFPAQPSVFFRRKVVENQQLRTDLHCSMDYDFWLRIGQKYRWKRINYALSADRNHLVRKSISQKNCATYETQMLRKNIIQSKINLLERVTDLFLKVWTRLGGFMLLYQIVRRHNKLTLSFEIPNLLHLLRTQLLGKDYELL